jgi:two-component system response regulator NreC
MAVGNSNKQIAEQLDISLQYVSYLKSKLRKKIGMRTNEEILKYALRTGLVSWSHLVH